MTVATHIHLVPRLRIHGAILHIPHVPSQCAPAQPYLYYEQNVPAIMMDHILHSEIPMVFVMLKHKEILLSCKKLFFGMF